MLREYELGLVINTELSDEQLEALLLRIGQTVETLGGEVVRLDRWGRRRLAYPIAHHREGYYAFLEFRLESRTVREVESFVLVQESIMRHIITYRDPRAQAERREREQRIAAQQEHQAAQANSPAEPTNTETATPAAPEIASQPEPEQPSESILADATEA